MCHRFISNIGILILMLIYLHNAMQQQYAGNHKVIGYKSCQSFTDVTIHWL